MKRRTPETSLQASVVQLLRFTHRPGVSWIAVPNEAKRTVAEAARLKRMGMCPGAGDLHICVDRRCHWLELKDGSRPQSQAQKDFQSFCEADGVPYEIARSFESAREILTRWGALKGEMQKRAA